MALKNTKQRTAILHVLEQNTEPMSADEILARLFACGESPALSTVYRNLERFAADGVASKDTFGDGVARYSLVHEHHGHYLVCTGCAAKLKIDGCPLSELERGLASQTGYEIEGHNLTIYGKCPLCAKKEKAE